MLLVVDMIGNYEKISEQISIDLQITKCFSLIYGLHQWYIKGTT